MFRLKVILIVGLLISTLYIVYRYNSDWRMKHRKER